MFPGGPLRGSERWFHETLAEAHFGLEQYDQAVERLHRAYPTGPKDVEPWEYETTARQFAWLARLQDPAATSTEDFHRSAPWKALREVFGANTAAGAASLFAGKLGLALSGGGFRASLFHIGVLAALAERDLLRHVEVLSCISGGSILGAHYYLEVRELFRKRSDEEITQDDYIRLVERLAEQFLLGVQENIRTQLGSSLIANLRMIFQPGYTETNRLGELYERHLYAQVVDDGQRVLRKLKIIPKGEEACNPKYDNWRRVNKVPILVLNATSVNTGHNWQFTSSWMGEPPAHIDSEIDGNYRLRRMYLDDEAPEPHKDIRLGAAVAASACVPGLFSPLEISGLYEGITVRLVDGGVHDNQGISGLLDQNCSVMIVSDASGQMASMDRPSDGRLDVLLRATRILQAKVRSGVHREIKARTLSGRIKAMLFLHLKKDLTVEEKDWEGCDNPKEYSHEELKKRVHDLTDYGVLKKLQEKIANLRTDLDLFNDTEALALMTSGCAMARAYLDQILRGFPVTGGQHDWCFLEISSALKSREPEKLKRLSHVLDEGSATLFKVWSLWFPLRVVSWIGGVALAIGLISVILFWSSEPLMSLKGLTAAVSFAVVSLVIARIGLGWLVKALNYKKTIRQILLGVGLSIVGKAVAVLHLRVFDRRFLKEGRFPDRSGS